MSVPHNPSHPFTATLIRNPLPYPAFNVTTISQQPDSFLSNGVSNFAFLVSSSFFFHPFICFFHSRLFFFFFFLPLFPLLIFIFLFFRETITSLVYDSHCTRPTLKQFPDNKMAFKEKKNVDNINMLGTYLIEKIFNLTSWSWCMILWGKCDPSSLMFTNELLAKHHSYYEHKILNRQINK